MGDSDTRVANEEGLIIHAGLRTGLFGESFSVYDHDEKFGFVYIEADSGSDFVTPEFRYRYNWDTGSY